MFKGPVAVGGIGGSGTRVAAKILQKLGVFIGSDLPPSTDTVWYAALFGRRDVLLDDDGALFDLAELFFRQMSRPQSLSPDELACVLALVSQTRQQPSPEILQGWLDGFIAHCKTGQAHPLWGWKIPYTYILINRFLGWRSDLKYIHMTRDGRDMAFSDNQNQLTHWGPIFLQRDVETGPRDALSFWCAVHRYMAQVTARFPNRVFHLDYDLLVQDPQTHLKALFAFLGADVSPELLAECCEFIFVPPSMGRHRTHEYSDFRSEDLAYLEGLETAAPERSNPALNMHWSLEQDIQESKSLKPGGDHYRAYVGPPGQYDFMGATQFRLLTSLGLREEHHLVDLGCGSLRAGKYILQYLLPGRYIGIEPNSHLWQKALHSEIGHDVIALKAPFFSEDDSLELKDVRVGAADFIVAQSIYSHTGEDLFSASMRAAATKLSSAGQFLFTVITKENPGFGTMAHGEQSGGWIYPQCVSYRNESIERICVSAGLQVQELPWYHPRQTWFRAVLLDTSLLDEKMITALGTGRPLLDPRFPR